MFQTTEIPFIKKVICLFRLLHLFADIIDYVSVEPKSVDPDQTAPEISCK